MYSTPINYIPKLMSHVVQPKKGKKKGKKGKKKNKSKEELERGEV